MDVIEFDRVIEIEMFEGPSGELFTTWIDFFVNDDLSRMGCVIEQIEI